MKFFFMFSCTLSGIPRQSVVCLKGLLVCSEAIESEVPVRVLKHPIEQADGNYQ